MTKVISISMQLKIFEQDVIMRLNYNWMHISQQKPLTTQQNMKNIQNESIFFSMECSKFFPRCLNINLGHICVTFSSVTHNITSFHENYSFKT